VKDPTADLAAARAALERADDETLWWHRRSGAGAELVRTHVLRKDDSWALYRVAGGDEGPTAELVAESG
jgi:hypothetical protein